MRQTDILIAGGGLAGSTAAAMLGRAGYSVVLVDPHAVYPPDFRAEKLDGTQAAVLRKTGLADAVLRAATLDGESWVARFGRLLEKRPGDQHGILYDTLVNTMRGEIPPSVDFIHAKVMDVATSADRQTVTLSTGEADFRAPRRRGERAQRRPAPQARHGAARHLEDALDHARLRSRAGRPRGLLVSGAHLLRRAPSRPHRLHHAVSDRRDDAREPLRLSRHGRSVAASNSAMRRARRCMALMPGLAKITGAYDVPGRVQIRPADLYVTDGVEKPGVVLIGDAFSTSCPTAGTGTGKVFTDVERLCNVYIPRWLATPGMGAEKIAAFYDGSACARPITRIRRTRRFICAR